MYLLIFLIVVSSFKKIIIKEKKTMLGSKGSQEEVFDLSICCPARIAVTETSTLCGVISAIKKEKKKLIKKHYFVKTFWILKHLNIFKKS